MFSTTYDCPHLARNADYINSEHQCYPDLDTLATVCCVAESTETQNEAVPVADIAGSLGDENSDGDGMTNKESLDSENEDNEAPNSSDVHLVHSLAWMVVLMAFL